MSWILVDLALGFFGVVAFGVVGLNTYRHGRALVRTLGASATALAAAAPDLNGVQTEGTRRR